MILAAALAAGLLALKLARRRHKSAAELERERRLQINAGGRITEGSLVQLTQYEGARLLSYQYAVAGVTYNAVQDVTALPHAVPPEGVCDGLPVRVKYDPQNPSDSIVVSETWNGLK